MAQDMVDATALRFGVGSVVSAGYTILKRNFRSFILLTLVLGLPVFVLAFISGFLGAAFGATLLLSDGISIGLAILVLLLGVAILSAYSLLGGALTYGVVQDLHGRTASFGESLRQAFRVLPQLIGVGLIFGLILVLLSLPATFIGVFYFLILIPIAIVLSILWWVALPAVLVERIGSLAGLSRSMALTSGRRWSILGIMLVTVVINLAIGIIPYAVSLISEGLGTVLSVFVNVIVTTWGLILPAVGYYILRNEKEGTDIAVIARVFD